MPTLKIIHIWAAVMMRIAKISITIVLLVCIGIPVAFRMAAALRETDRVADILPAEGRMVATNSGDIFLQELGPVDGLPVLLAHGTAAWSGLWRETMEALAKNGYRAIAFDMPPFGFSERDPKGNYSRPRQAERILDLVQALEIKPVLAAHSFGASAGMEAVLMAPEAFTGLIIIDGAIGLGNAHEDGMIWPLSSEVIRPFLVATTGTNPLLTKMFARQMIYRKDQLLPKHVDILQRPMSRRESTQSMSDWVPSLLATPSDALSTRRESYASFSLKTVIIWGDEDTVTPPEQATDLAAVIDDSTILMLEDVGHIPQIEDPEQFQVMLLQAILEF